MNEYFILPILITTVLVHLCSIIRSKVIQFQSTGVYTK